MQNGLGHSEKYLLSCWILFNNKICPNKLVNTTTNFFEVKGMYLVSFFYQQINSCMFVSAIPSKGCRIKSAVTSTSFQSKISRKVFVSFWSKYSINYSSCCIISLRYQTTCSVKYNSVLQLHCYCVFFVFVYLLDLTILLHRFRRKLLWIHFMENTYIIFKENVYYPPFNVS